MQKGSRLPLARRGTGLSKCCSAYASFDKGIKNSIEAGKLAVLIVLNGRILDAAPERIKDLHVELTMIDGEIVYQKQGREVMNG
jgi:predicted amidohydrolase YtcJ